VDGGLMRVDVMCMSDGKLVVNEFESLEACYAPVDHNEIAHVDELLVNYWLNKLTSILLADESA
jgi:hypothetical protein